MVNAFHTDSGLVSTALRPIRKKFAKPPVKVACLPCRASRIRCGGQQPCSNVGFHSKYSRQRDETGEPSIAGYYWPKAFTADDDSSNCSPLKCN
ncbi:hypothetical protein N7513_003419 [Penicillium frequentans]|nr:hypothetical protein N7513_003419 [Penicillium glabrum]